MRRAAAIIGAILASGAMLHAALPPIGWWWLAWFAFVPLFIAVKGARFLVGFLAGLGATGTTAFLAIQGVGYGYRSSEGSPSWIMVGCVLFGFAVSIVTGMAAESKLASPLRLAACAVLLEACLLIYLPASIALTQARVSAALFFASMGGIWGVSYLVWLSNTWLAHHMAEGRKVPAILGLVGVYVVLGALGSTMKPLSGAAIPVIVVQTDETDLAALGRLTGTNPAALAVWPEFAGLEAASGGDTTKLREFAAVRPGIITTFQDTHTPLPHNVAALFASGQESARYEKRKLFGGETSMHTAGNQAVIVPWRDTRVGLNICFDSCFPGIMRETALKGAKLIALPTIDPPSPHHWIAAMHAASTPFRAAELGIPIARADGNAYSMLVDARGNIVLELPPGKASAQGDLPTTTEDTLYRSIGDWPLWICGLALFGSSVQRLRRQKKAAEAPTPKESA